MKSKKEKKLNNGEGKEMPAENAKNHDTSNEVHEQNASVNAEPKSPDDMGESVSLIEQWAPFLTKFIKVMIAVEDLVEAKKTMESDPCFVHVMKKFMEFKEKYDAEHPEEMEEVTDDFECEDEALFDMVKQMKENLQAHGISVKVRKVTNPEEVEKFERFMKGTPPRNGATKMAEA